MRPMKYLKTEAGQQAFKTRSALLTARQRSAFILFDGVRSSEQVLAATVGLGITQGDVDHLVEQGFLVVVPPSDLGSASSASAVSTGLNNQAFSASARLPRERYSAAMPLATKVTAKLGLRGFRLNLAVEAAAGYDDLLALLPKIQAAAGTESCLELERALKG